jgi:hypothetical protein
VLPIRSVEKSTLPRYGQFERLLGDVGNIR